MAKISIAVDGPAGAGKSTVAKSISRTLGIIYLDTGAMYRAVALKAMRSGVDTRSQEGLAELVRDVDIKISYSGDEQHIFLEGRDVSKEIRMPEVSIGASNVAAIPAVRLKLVELQREIAASADVVMDGRDIGTYVLPNASCKFFLTASLEERAKRRYSEQVEKGITGISIENVQKDISYRDKNDSSREFAPLSRAQDAILVDTTDMTIQEVTEYILAYIKKSDAWCNR